MISNGAFAEGLEQAEVAYRHEHHRPSGADRGGNRVWLHWARRLPQLGHRRGGI